MEIISNSYLSLYYEETIINLEKAVEHSIAYSTRADEHKYSSLLVNTLEDKTTNSSKSSEKNDAYHLKNWIEEIYTAILDDERVKDMLKNIGKYAN